MRLLLFFCLLYGVQSCTRLIQPGTYVFNKVSTITIEPSGRYTYWSGVRMGTRASSSSGRVIQKKQLIYFEPDSGEYIKINSVKLLFDPALKGDRRIIIEGNTDSLSEYSFSLYERGRKEHLPFNEGLRLTYHPQTPWNELSDITILARLAPGEYIVPPLYHDSIYSRQIELPGELEENYEKEWNVVVLNVQVNIDMFMFRSLPVFIYRNKKLIQSDWPVFSRQ